MRQSFTMRAAMAIVLSALWLHPGEVLADDATGQYLVLTQNDGGITEIALSRQPVVSFDKDTLVVTSDDDLLRIPLAQVSDYRFKTVTTGIESPAVLPNTPSEKPAVAFGKATFSGLKAGQRVTVYNMGGQVVSTVRCDDNGTATVNLRDLPKGVYILRSPSQSIKVINR